MVNSKKVQDCTQYQQILYKFLKLVEYELASQNDAMPVIVIPLDFLTLLNIQNKGAGSQSASEAQNR